MSEENITSAPPVAEPPARAVSAGALLRQAREASGLHVAALAVAMKVPVKKLEALEADRWDLLTDAVFVRGLASSVCRALKVDPTEVLSKLPQSSVPRLDSEVRGINTPFQGSRQNPVASMSAYVSKPTVLLVFGLLLAALVILFFPNTHTSTTVATATVEPLSPQAQGSAVFASEPVLASPEAAASAAAVVVSAPVSVAVVAPPASAPATAPASAPASSPVALVAPVAVKAASVPVAPVAAKAASVPVAPASARGVLAPVVAPAATAAAPTSSAATHNGSIGFKAKATSWVEVTDARKVVLIRRSVFAGEKVEVSGALPLSVVIGAANAVAVEVHGKPFSLDGIAITNVARFEVK